MRKSDIEKKIADKFHLESDQSEQILDTIIDKMTEVLSEDERIEIRGFGSFFTKRYGSYGGRNPRTGDYVAVPEKKLPHFRPSKELLSRLNSNSPENKD